MGVLYDSSRPPQCHMKHDSFCILDDRSSISFSTRYRNSCYSKTSSSLYHSFLLVICRVGHVHDAIHPRSLPEFEDHANTNDTNENAKSVSNRPLEPLITSTIRGESISCDAGNQKSVNALTRPIHHSRLGTAIESNSLRLGHGLRVNSRPRIQPAGLGDAQTSSLAQPFDESIKDRQNAGSRQEKQKMEFSLLNDNFNAEDVPLPPSPLLIPSGDRLSDREDSLASITGGIRKRLRDESDDDIIKISVSFKKAMTRSRTIAVSLQGYDHRIIGSALTAQASDRSSVFDSLRWLDVDWKALSCAPSNNAQGYGQVSLAPNNRIPADLPPAPLTLIKTTKRLSDKPDTSFTSFVSAMEKFDILVGNKCDAVARFAKDETHCLANNKYGRRCNSWDGIPVEYRPIVGMLLAQLKVLNFESNATYCVNWLLALTNLAVCKHQRTAIREQVAHLRPHDSGSHKYLPLLLPYRPPESAHLTVNDFVARQAMEPFDVDPDSEKRSDPRNKLDADVELGKGYIYIYWNEATFGVLKIGFTTREVSVRLGEWETDCGHAAKQQYSSPCKVQHVARVEQLVHAELLNYRVFEPACRTCLKSHIEWFRGVHLAFVVERIEVWSQWMSEGPYQKVDRKWQLTHEGRERMPVITDPNSCRKLEVRTKLPTDPPRRYNLRHTKGRKACP